MKGLLIILQLLFSTFLFGQYDSLFVDIKDDTVKVWNTKVEENCIFSVVFDVKISDDVITIIEHDTTTMKATCGCTFDLCANLINLESNNYTVNVYRKYSVEYYNPDSLYYIGSSSFSFTKPNDNVFVKTFYQSSCYHVESVDNIDEFPEEFYLLESYPNPFNSQANIKVFLPDKADIKLKLYDNLGQLLKIIASGSFNKGSYTFKLDASKYTSGNYFITLEADNRLLKSVKITLLK